MADKRYLFTFTPLEPWFFGEEKNLGFDNFGEDKKQKHLKNTYFIRSGIFPSQSTVIGSIRYVVLKQNGGLSRDGVRLSEEQKRLIGDKSFDLEAEEIQEFGSVKRIGPVHLYDGKREYFHLPNNCYKTERNDISSYVMVPSGFRDGKKIFIPEGFDAKEGVFRGFASVDEELACRSVSEIFGSTVRSRNLKNARNENDNRKNAFFKKEYRFFNKTEDEKVWSFCCEVTVDESIIPAEDVIYMGQDKSAFAFRAILLGDGKSASELYRDSLVGRIQVPQDMQMAVALSDIYFSSDYADITACAMTDFRNFRFMTSAHNSGNAGYFDRLKKSSLYHLVSAGSIFLFMKDQRSAFEGLYNRALENTGFNQFMFFE